MGKCVTYGTFVHNVNGEVCVQSECRKKKIKSAPKSDLFTFSGVYKVCFAMILDPWKKLNQKIGQ